MARPASWLTAHVVAENPSEQSVETGVPGMEDTWPLNEQKRQHKFLCTD